MEAHEMYGWSFTERMQQAKDAKTLKTIPSRLGGRVRRYRGPLIRWLTLEQARAELAGLDGIPLSAARLKVLCGSGRIRGAKRLKTGKGSPWSIPARLQGDGESYRVEVTPAVKGPRLGTHEKHDPIPI